MIIISENHTHAHRDHTHTHAHKYGGSMVCNQWQIQCSMLVQCLVWVWGSVPIVSCFKVLLYWWRYNIIVPLCAHEYDFSIYWVSLCIFESINFSEGHFLHCQHFWVQFWYGLSKFTLDNFVIDYTPYCNAIICIFCLTYMHYYTVRVQQRLLTIVAFSQSVCTPNWNLRSCHAGMYTENNDGKLLPLKTDHDVLNLKEREIVIVEIKD